MYGMHNDRYSYRSCIFYTIGIRGLSALLQICLAFNHYNLNLLPNIVFKRSQNTSMKRKLSKIPQCFCHILSLRGRLPSTWAEFNLSQCHMCHCKLAEPKNDKKRMLSLWKTSTKYLTSSDITGKLPRWQSGYKVKVHVTLMQSNHKYIM